MALRLIKKKSKRMTRSPANSKRHLLHNRLKLRPKRTPQNLVVRAPMMVNKKQRKVALGKRILKKSQLELISLQSRVQVLLRQNLQGQIIRFLEDSKSLLSLVYPRINRQLSNHYQPKMSWHLSLLVDQSHLSRTKV